MSQWSSSSRISKVSVQRCGVSSSTPTILTQDRPPAQGPRSRSGLAGAGPRSNEPAAVTYQDARLIDPPPQRPTASATKRRRRPSSAVIGSPGSGARLRAVAVGATPSVEPSPRFPASRRVVTVRDSGGSVDWRAMTDEGGTASGDSPRRAPRPLRAEHGPARARPGAQPPRHRGDPPRMRPPLRTPPRLRRHDRHPRLVTRRQPGSVDLRRSVLRQRHPVRVDRRPLRPGGRVAPRDRRADRPHPRGLRRPHGQELPLGPTAPRPKDLHP